MRDTVTEINIGNPAAKEAFIRWWRMMEAQGYSYGYEALCNVWVGFDDGRADLARKIIAAVTAEQSQSEQRGPQGSDDEFDQGRYAASTAIAESLRELFWKEGVNVPDDKTAER